MPRWAGIAVGIAAVLGIIILAVYIVKQVF